MTESKETVTSDSERTPSMFASLFVLGVMIVLIVLSVLFFGNEVADGGLQVSMTLATLVALGVAHYYGFRGAVINKAIMSGITEVIGTIFVILAIGMVIGTLYLTGTVANILYYGVAIISPQFFYVTIFIIALVLSSLLGSSLTTVGAVGVSFVGLASIMGVSPAITAGAAVSGAIMGNKIVKISDTVQLTVATVGGLTVDEHLRSVRRTTIPTVLISGVLFLLLGLTGGSAAAAGCCAGSCVRLLVLLVHNDSIANCHTPPVVKLRESDVNLREARFKGENAKMLAISSVKPGVTPIKPAYQREWD